MKRIFIFLGGISGFFPDPKNNSLSLVKKMARNRNRGMWKRDIPAG